MPKITPAPVYYDDQHYKNGAGEEVLADTHREFPWKGKQLITYLTQENAERFDEFIESYAEFATAVPTSGSASTARPSNRSGPGNSTKSAERIENREIREWCFEQSMEISERGRIPNWARKAYFEAHPDKKPVVPLS